jgi:glycosyltransferase involved in cell wall biosynthesis
MDQIKINFYGWLPLSGYSGGRYLSLCLANSLANSGCIVKFYTNQVDCKMAHECFADTKVSFRHISSQKDRSDFGIIIPNGPGDHHFYNLFMKKAIELNHKNIFYNFESGNWWNFQSPYKKDIRDWDPWKNVAKKCNTILSISETGNEWSRKFYDCEDFIYEAGPINIRYQPKLKSKKKQILIMSRVGPTSQHKGWSQIHLLNSKVVSGYKIIINTGNSKIHNATKTSLSNEFAKNNISIEFVSSISESEKTKMMRESSFLFFATEFEGLGMPPLEAISLGTNVLCSDLPVLRETGDGYYCFFNNESLNIDDQISNALHKEIGEESILEFYNKFNMESISKSLIVKLKERMKK